MRTNPTKALSTALIALAILIALAVPDTLAEDAPELRTLQVMGHAGLSVEPDRATITLSVETQRTEAMAAASQNAELTTAVTMAVKSLLGESDTVQTSSYRLDPVNEYDSTRKRHELVGYKATNTVTIVTFGLDTLGGLIDAATSAGANRVSGLAFDTSKRDEHRKEVLMMAVKDAQLTAVVVAGAAGVRLVRILQINPSYHQPVPHRAYAMELRGAKSADTPIEAGEIEVRATVSILYEID